jgi:hypothetical protein
MKKLVTTHVFNAIILAQTSLLTPSTYAVEMDERIEITGSWMGYPGFYVDLYYGGNPRPQLVEVHNSPRGGGGSTSPYAMTEAEEKEFYKEAYDKTLWTQNQIDSLKATLATFAEAMEKLAKLAEYGDLNPDMAQQLLKAADKAVKIIDYLNSGNDIYNAVINDRFAGALATITEVIVGAGAVKMGAIAIVTIGGLPGIAVGAFVAVLGTEVAEYMGDFVHDGLTDPEFSDWVRSLGRRMDYVPWEPNSPNYFKYVCENFPYMKWDRIEGCTQGVVPLMRSAPTQQVAQVERDKVYALFVDLNNDGFKLTNSIDLDSQIGFSDDGATSMISWVDAKDAVLFIDLNNSGVMDDINEFMFVEASEVREKVNLNGLKQFDTNQNGLLDRKDMSYDQFYLWSDLNEDGLSTQDEVRSVSQSDMYFQLATSSMSTDFNEQTLQESFQAKFNFSDVILHSGSFRLSVEKKGQTK